MFSKVIIANRGEIAVRIARTCRELGVASVSVYSDPDTGARHVSAADEAVHLPGTAAAETIAEAGLVWIGPPPEATRAVGDKVRARRLASDAGVSVVPGTLEPVGGAEEVHAFGEEHGYPIAIKAARGGGGRGLRVARAPEEVASALESAVRESRAYFGHGDVYLERYLDEPKHVEVQTLSSRPGESMWLGARDCSLQRRHQKL